ncbi:MAG: hypothetical protein U5K84_01230 [Alkalibacterium sp.]|nr:hypothetical protein [Alkalibacterium sp.]
MISKKRADRDLPSGLTTAHPSFHWHDEIKKVKFHRILQLKKNDRNFFPCGTNQVRGCGVTAGFKSNRKGSHKRLSRSRFSCALSHKGNAGIDRLNKSLQDLFNPKGEYKKKLCSWIKSNRIGDKVLQLINEPGRNVFNGDMGIITGIITSKESAEQCGGTGDRL